jgi:hypothetical protein
MDGIQGARIWCGYGVLAHNLVKLSDLHQVKQKDSMPSANLEPLH